MKNLVNNVGEQMLGKAAERGLNKWNQAEIIEIC